MRLKPEAPLSPNKRQNWETNEHETERKKKCGCIIRHKTKAFEFRDVSFMIKPFQTSAG